MGESTNTSQQRRRFVALGLLGAVVLAGAFAVFPAAAERFTWNCGSGLSTLNATEREAFQTNYGLQPWAEVPNPTSPLFPTTATITDELPGLGTITSGTIETGRDEARRDAGLPPVEASVRVLNPGTLLLGVGTKQLAVDGDGNPLWGIRGEVLAQASSDDGSRLALATRHGELATDVIVLDAASGDQLMCTRVAINDPERNLDQIPVVGMIGDETVILQHISPADEDRDYRLTVTRIDVATGDVVRTDYVGSLAYSIMANESVAVLSFRPRGSALIFDETNREPDDPALAAFDAESAEPRWLVEGRITLQLLASGGTSLAQRADESETELVALDPDGEVRWSYGGWQPPDNTSNIGVAVFETTALVEDGATLLALDLATGEQIWSMPRPGGEGDEALEVEFSSWNGEDVLGVADGDLISLDLATGEATTTAQPVPLTRIEPVSDGWLIRGEGFTLTTTGVNS